MDNINESEKERESIVNKVCDFLCFKRPKMYSLSTAESIKELCVARLCKSIGITGPYNYKSKFFNFYSSIMGEALCEIFKLKIHVATDEIRLFKYEGVNLIERAKKYLLEESIEEAVLDVFNLADKFKYLIKS